MSRLPNIRFSKERDNDLIEWVESISHLPNGLKGEAVKDVLRMGLEEKTSNQAKEVVVPKATKANRPSQTHLAQLDIPSPICALRNEFLADIRMIAEASISQALEGIHPEDAKQTPNQESEAEDILDSFADLMLED